MDEAAGRDAVKRLTAKFSAGEAYYVDLAGPYKESDTRSEFIDPLLRALGWDVTNEAGVVPHLRDVVREESQEQEDATDKYPDYTMRIRGDRRFFIEAKKPSVDVTAHMKSIRQARQYGYTGRDPIVVLTNFRDLVVFDTTVPVDISDQPSTGRIRRWRYDEFESKFDELHATLGRTNTSDPDWALQFQTADSRYRLRADEEFVRQFNEWRLLLGSDLYSQDNSIHIDDLNDAVQRVLNRLIFVRMCEDRGIEGQQTLFTAASGGAVKITSLLNRLHRRYNTGLFEGTSAPLAAKVRDQTLKAIVTGLYTPYSPFSFAVLDATFLGLVYEASLTEHLTLVTRNGQTHVALQKKQEYEHREVVSTPQELVDGTVRAAVSALSPHVTEPKTLDFSVGSGRFLLSVFDRLLENETERQRARGDSSLIRSGPNEYRLPFAQKKRLLTANLFGIDIDYNAVELARFSLLVRLLQDETKHTLPAGEHEGILPDLATNIVWGNTLVRELASGESKEQLDLTRPLDLSTTNLPREWDLCVGNPPYMSPERMKRLDKVEYEYLEKNYVTSFQQFDKYFCFIEFAAKHLKEGGVLGTVVPNKWMTVAAGQKLRDLFRGDLRLLQLANFREAQLFPGKTIYVCCLVGRKGPGARLLYSEPKDLRSYSTGQTPVLEISESSLPTSSTGAWVLCVSKEEERVLRRITDHSIPLEEVVDPRNGIQTSAERNERYLISHPNIAADGLIRWVDKFGNENEIEASLTRPFLKDSRGVRSFHEITSDTLIIFPYMVSDSAPSGWEVMPTALMQRDFPRAYAYFLQHKEELDRRDMSVSERRKAFYAYGRSQAIPYATQAPKILYSTNQRGQKYGLDLTGVVYASGGTAGEIALYPKGNQYELDFLLGLLDQPPIELFLRKRGSVFRGGYYARGTDVIAETPVPALDFRIAADKAFHDEVTTRVRHLRALHSQTPQVSQREHARHNMKIATSRDQIRELFNTHWRLQSSDIDALGIVS